MIACTYELGYKQFSKSLAAWTDMPGDLQGCMAEFLALCELFSRKFGWHVQQDNARTASKSDLKTGRLALMAVLSLCCQEALADPLVCLLPERP